MRADEIKRLAPLLSYVSSKNSLRLLGPNDPERRAPTVSVQTKENPTHIAEKLAQRGIAVGGDNFYGVRPLEAMGLDSDVGVLRMSFVHYTSTAEVDRLMNALDDIL